MGRRGAIAGCLLAALLAVSCVPLSAHAAEAPAPDQVAAGQQREFVEGEVVVVLSDAVPADDGGAQVAQCDVVAAVEPAGDGAVLAQLEDGVSVAAAMTALEQEPAVQRVQPNYVYQLMDVPDDPYASTDDSDGPNQWYLQSIGAPSAWDLQRCQGSVTVAVLDTGVNFEHADLAVNLDVKHAWDATTASHLSTSSQGNGMAHGTHVAGIIAAVAGNGRGFAGVSYNAKVLPVNIFDADGKSTTKTITAAYDHLAKLMDSGELSDLHVINLSVGSGDSEDDDQALHDAIASMEQRNVVTVCAAGNTTSMSATATCYPADYDECISVTALDDADEVSWFSCHNQWKDIAAPGSAIWSTFDSSDGDCDAMRDKGTDDVCAKLSGTSQAAPMVSGAVALLYAYDPDLTVQQVKAALYQSAVDLGDTGRDDYYGWGKLNMSGALEYVMGLDDVAPQVLVSQLPSAELGQEYACELLVGGSPWPTVTVEGLPQGLAYDSKTGRIQGVPTQSGTFTVAVAAENGVEPSAAAALELEVERTPVTWTRLGGDTRFDTMALTVQQGFPGDASCTYVIVASGAEFADALAASALSGALDAPVIISSPDKLDAQARGQVARLATGDTTVLIVGGNDALGQEVESQLRDIDGVSQVQRIAGSTRIGTGIALYQSGATADLWGDTCIVANGWSFADVLSAGSYAATECAPVFVTLPDGTLTSQQVQTIRKGGFTKVVVLGGDAVVDFDSVKKALGSTVSCMRIAGTTRIETSCALAMWATGCVEDAAFQPDTPLQFDGVCTAYAFNFPDALTAVNIAGAAHAPVVLISADTQQQAAASQASLQNLLTSHKDSIKQGWLLGGTTVLPSKVMLWCRDSTA